MGGAAGMEQGEGVEPANYKRSHAQSLDRDSNPGAGGLGFVPMAPFLVDADTRVDVLPVGAG